VQQYSQVEKVNEESKHKFIQIFLFNVVNLKHTVFCVTLLYGTWWRSVLIL